MEMTKVTQIAFLPSREMNRHRNLCFLQTGPQINDFLQLYLRALQGHSRFCSVMHRLLCQAVSTSNTKVGPQGLGEPFFDSLLEKHRERPVAVHKHVLKKCNEKKYNPNKGSTVGLQYTHLIRN